MNKPGFVVVSAKFEVSGCGDPHDATIDIAQTSTDSRKDWRNFKIYPRARVKTKNSYPEILQYSCPRFSTGIRGFRPVFMFAMASHLSEVSYLWPANETDFCLL